MDEALGLRVELATCGKKARKGFKRRAKLQYVSPEEDLRSEMRENSSSRTAMTTCMRTMETMTMKLTKGLG